MADFGLPPDLDLERRRIERRQALADALLQQSLRPIQQTTAGGRVLPIHPFQGLAQLGGAYFGARGQAKGDEAYSALGEKYNTRLGEGVRDYMRTRQGTPASSEVIMDEQANDGMGREDIITAPGVKGNPQEAAIKAMTSGIGPLMRLGQSDLTTMGKGTMTTKDILSLSGYDAATKVAVANMVANGVPFEQVMAQLKADPKIIQHGGFVGQVTPGQAPTSLGELGSNTIPENWRSHLPPNAQLGQAPGQYYMPGAGGARDLYQLEFTGGKYTGSKKLDNAPKISVDARPAGVKVGLDTAFREAGQHVSKMGQAAQSAAQMRQSIQEMKRLESQGMFSNVTSGPVTFMTNLAKSLGADLTPEQKTKLSSTEGYNAVAVGLWQEMVSRYGGNRGVTKEEAEKIMEMLPLAKNDPGSRQEIFGILERAATRQENLFKGANQAYWGMLSSENPQLWRDFNEKVYLPHLEQHPPINSVPPTPSGPLRPYKDGQ